MYKCTYVVQTGADVCVVSVYRGQLQLGPAFSAVVQQRTLSRERKSFGRLPELLLLLIFPFEATRGTLVRDQKNAWRRVRESRDQCAQTHVLD